MDLKLSADSRVKKLRCFMYENWRAIQIIVLKESTRAKQGFKLNNVFDTKERKIISWVKSFWFSTVLTRFFYLNSLFSYTWLEFKSYLMIWYNGEHLDKVVRSACVTKEKRCEDLAIGLSDFITLIRTDMFNIFRPK